MLEGVVTVVGGTVEEGVPICKIHSSRMKEKYFPEVAIDDLLDNYLSHARLAGGHMSEPVTRASTAAAYRPPNG